MRMTRKDLTLNPTASSTSVQVDRMCKWCAGTLQQQQWALLLLSQTDSDTVTIAA